MKRVALMLLAVVATAAAPRGAAAQGWYFGRSNADTAIGLLTDAETQLPVRLSNSVGSYYYLYRTRLTFHFDPNDVDVIGVVGDALGNIYDTTRTASTFSVGATGCAAGTDVSALRLRVKLKAGAPNGTHLWATSDTTQLWYYCYYGAPFESQQPTGASTVCRAVDQYGDVDGNARVDSRDALIALSAAVGLPVSGFNLGLGDVDQDGLTNSRDALMLLSYSIGLSVASSSRIGMGVPVACPGLTPPGEIVALRIRIGSDSLALLQAAANIPVAIPNTGAYPAGPRLAANGTTLVFRCQPYYQGICRVNADGTGYAEVSPAFTSGDRPDWNPAGTAVAFRYYGYPYKSDSIGLTSLSGNSNGGSVVWSRDGTKVAYAASDGIHLVNADGTGDALVPISGVSDPILVRFSPAGDSLAFTRSCCMGIWVAPLTGGTPAHITSFRTTGQFSGQEMGFDWGPPGLIFGMEDPAREGLWLLQSIGGPLLRITSGNHLEPAFRRNP